MKSLIYLLLISFFVCTDLQAQTNIKCPVCDVIKVHEKKLDFSPQISGPDYTYLKQDLIESEDRFKKNCYLVAPGDLQNPTYRLHMNGLCDYLGTTVHVPADNAIAALRIHYGVKGDKMVLLFELVMLRSCPGCGKNNFTVEPAKINEDNVFEVNAAGNPIFPSKQELHEMLNLNRTVSFVRGRKEMSPLFFTGL